MRSLLLFPLVLLLACTHTAADGAAAGEGDACRAHRDCAAGLYCSDASETCRPDECVTGDDCDNTRVGESRCETIGGITYAKTCAYDGDRCLEWAPEACDEGQRCAQQTEGARCLDDP